MATARTANQMRPAWIVKDPTSNRPREERAEDRFALRRCSAGKPSDMKSARPRMKSAMPSVTRKEVMPIFATRTPLASPMRTASADGRPASASSGASPRCSTSVYMTSGTKPKTLPTERSKMPAVSSSVMPRAMMPNSGMKANMFETFVNRHERRLEVGQHDPGADEQRDRDDLGRARRSRCRSLAPTRGHRRCIRGSAHADSTRARWPGSSDRVSVDRQRRRARADRPASLRGQLDVLVGRRGVVERLGRDVVADGQAGRGLDEQDDRVVARGIGVAPRWRR